MCKACGRGEESTEHMIKCREMMKKIEKRIEESMSVSAENIEDAK